MKSSKTKELGAGIYFCDAGSFFPVSPAVFYRCCRSARLCTKSCPVRARHRSVLIHTPSSVDPVCRSILRTQAFDEHRVLHQHVGHDPHAAIISCPASPRPLSKSLARHTGALLGSSHTLLRPSARMDGGWHSSHAGPDVVSYRPDITNRGWEKQSCALQLVGTGVISQGHRGRISGPKELPMAFSWTAITRTLEAC